MVEVFEQLRNAADGALKDAPAGSIQVLVTKTEKGEISTFVNDLSSTEEERFLSAQKDMLAALLCVWANRQIDVPSMRIRKGLIQINPKNADAVVYLQGESIISKSLSQTI